MKRLKLVMALISVFALVGFLSSPIYPQTFITEEVPAVLQIKGFTKAGLPAAGIAGRLARVTDDVRGLWIDDGTAWRKIQPYVWVEDFAGDVQAAINAAAASGEYKEVKLAAKNYPVTAGLTTPVGAHLIISGTSRSDSVGTRITRDAGIAAGTPTLTISRGETLVRDLTIDNASDPGDCIEISAVGVTLQHIWCNNVGGDPSVAIDILSGAHEVSLSDVWARTAFVALKLNTVNAGVFNNLQLISTYTGTTRATIEITTSNGIHFSGGLVEHGPQMLKIDGSSSNIGFTNTYIETASTDTVPDIEIGSVTSDRVTGIRFDGIRMHQGATGGSGVFIQLHERLQNIWIGGGSSFRRTGTTDTSDIIQIYDDTTIGGVPSEITIDGVSTWVGGSVNYNSVNMTGDIAANVAIARVAIRNLGYGELVGADNGTATVQVRGTGINIENVEHNVTLNNSPTKVWLKGIGGAISGGAYTEIGSILSGSATWDPPSIADGAIASVNITVTGAAVGDYAVASHSALGSVDALLVANVIAADSVRAILFNKNGAALDVASGTVRVLVFKR